MNQSFALKKQMQEENQAFTAQIAREKELNKRETQRQNIVTMMNMFGS